MKGIATINFKGGVGKTTVSWLLAKYAADRKKQKVLVMDTDAQMSMTLAVTLQETGSFISGFGDWYEQHQTKRRTLFDALERYDEYARGKSKHFEAFIPDRVDIKRAVPRATFPTEFGQFFANLWTEVERYV